MLHLVRQLAVRSVLPAAACHSCTRKTSWCQDCERRRHLFPAPQRHSDTAAKAIRPTFRRSASVTTAPIAMPESVVEGLQPQALWEYFHVLTQLPRPSKHEDKSVSTSCLITLHCCSASHLFVSAERSLCTVKAAGLIHSQPFCFRVIAYLTDFASQRQLDFRQDSTGNMVIRRPGSGGGESALTVVIQVGILRQAHVCLHAL